MDKYYQIALTGAMIVMGILLFVCLFRAIKGPKTADRVIAVNMTGTVTIVMILLLTLMLNEGYLIDIALIYAMLSFLAVVLLCRIYIGIRLSKEKGEDRDA